VVAEALHLVAEAILVAEAHLIATVVEVPISTMKLLLLPGLYVNFVEELATPLLGATKGWNLSTPSTPNSEIRKPISRIPSLTTPLLPCQLRKMAPRYRGDSSCH
jgi:hypothetical protein